MTRNWNYQLYFDKIYSLKMIQFSKTTSCKVLLNSNSRFSEYCAEIVMSIQVLKGFRSILSSAGLNNEPFLPMKYFRIPTTIIRIAYTIPMNISLSLIILYSLDYGFDLNKVSGAFSLIVGITQIDLIYISLVTKSTLIMEIVNYFQDVVQRSNFMSNAMISNLYFFFFSNFRNKFTADL